MGVRGRSLWKILTKMSAFEAFTSDLEAESLWGSGRSPRKILTKMSTYEAFSSNLEAEPRWRSGGRAPRKF